MADEQEKVTLTDGSQVEFGTRDKVKKLSAVLPDGHSVEVKFAFRNGQVRTFQCDPSSPIYARAVQHGLDQKFGDEMAKLQDVDDCVLAFEKLAERLKAGDWRAARESDGLAGTSTLLQAIIRAAASKGVTKTVEQVKAQLAPLTPAQKAALRQTEPIKTHVEAIQAEKAAKVAPEKQAELQSALDNLLG